MNEVVNGNTPIVVEHVVESEGPDLESIFDKVVAGETDEGAAADETKEEPANDEGTADADTDEAGKEQTEEEKADASRFATLSRKDKALREREDAVKTKETELTELQTSVQDLTVLAKEDPLKVLEKLGLSLEDVYQRALSAGDDPSNEEKVDKVEDPKMLKLEGQIAELTNQLKEKDLVEQQKEADVIIGKLESDLITEITDDFKLISKDKEGAAKLAIEVIKEKLEKDKILLTPAEVLPLVESHYEQLAVERVKELEKYGYTVSKQEAPKSEDQLDVQSEGPTTLTAKHQQQAPTKEDGVQLTEEQRFERALKLLNYT